MNRKKQLKKFLPKKKFKGEIFYLGPAVFVGAWIPAQEYLVTAVELDQVNRSGTLFADVHIPTNKELKRIKKEALKTMGVPKEFLKGESKCAVDFIF
jgi:hypothetical protein